MSIERKTNEVALAFDSEVTHDGQAIEGGVLKYALVASSSSTGILIDELAQTDIDYTFAELVDISMFGNDGDRKLDDSGLASATFDVDAKTVTVSLTGKDYKWSDGQPFTIDDYILPLNNWQALIIPECVRIPPIPISLDLKNFKLDRRVKLQVLKK